MNRKMIGGFVAVYAMLVSVDLIMKILMWKFYPALPLHILRPRAEMKLLLCPIGFLFASFFLTFLFSKLYRGGGIGEGFRYGLYVDLMVNPLFAFGLYAFLPIDFTLVVSWFISRTVLLVLAGMVLAAVFGRTALATSAAQDLGPAARAA